MVISPTPPVQEKLYTIDDMWALDHDPAYELRKFYLIDGRLHEEDVPGRPHAKIASELNAELVIYNRIHDVGEVLVEGGFYPADDRFTLLLPDVAFMRHDSLPQPPPQAYVPAMPDLAIEILSPSDTMAQARRKAQVYLDNGTALVWLVQPEARTVEVCRLDDDARLDTQIVGLGERLSGEEVLPGFVLEVSDIFRQVERR